MLFSRIAVLATAVAAAVVRRDAAQILADLEAIESDYVNLALSFFKYNGGGLGPYIPALRATKQIDDDFKRAITDSNTSGSLSEADAQTIIDYLTKHMEPVIDLTMTILATKKSTIDANGLTTLVHDNLVLFKNDTDVLGASLKGRTPTDKQGAASTILAQIDADFQKEIDQYST